MALKQPAYHGGRAILLRKASARFQMEGGPFPSLDLNTDDNRFPFALHSAAKQTECGREVKKRNICLK